MKELDSVVLMQDVMVAGEELKSGTRGVIVHMTDERYSSCLVEFFDDYGETIDVFDIEKAKLKIID